MNMKDMVADILANCESKGGVKSLYLVACGGSLGGFYPAQYLVEHVAKKLRCGLFTSNEFVYATPDSCDENSLVLACSMRGTPETVEAVKTAKAHGATTVAFYVEQSALVDCADYSIEYGSLAVDETRIENTNASLQLRFCFELLHQLEGCPLYEDAQAAFAIINDIYLDAAAYCRPRAEAFAAACKDEPVIYVLGSGPSMGAAYVFSICNLMEMQWIHSPTVNNGELLHGPFESVDKNLPIFMLISEGRTRPVDMRALKFLQTYGEKLCLLDAKEIGINRINKSVAEYFNHILFSSLLNNVYLRELSYARKHNYMNRRYMWQVDY